MDFFKYLVMLLRILNRFQIVKILIVENFVDFVTKNEVPIMFYLITSFYDPFINSHSSSYSKKYQIFYFVNFSNFIFIFDPFEVD